MGKPVTGLSDEALQHLVNHEWPGNVRQLRNVIERAVIQCETDVIGLRDLAFGAPEDDLDVLLANVPSDNTELKEIKKQIRTKAVSRIEKRFVLQALNRSNWNVTRAARQVGLKRTNFQAMMKKHGIRRAKS